MTTQQRRLGKLAPRRDPRTYCLHVPLMAAMSLPPASRDWSQGVAYRMWGNDRYGDCAFAAHAALVSTWTHAAQADVVLTDAEVLANYAAVTGFDPATGANDNGTVLLDQINHWRRTGLERPGQTLDYLTAYGLINPSNVAAIKRAIAYLGGVMAGVQVPKGFMALGLGETWDITKLSGEDLDPIGGHAIALTGYNPSGIFFCTWGSRTFMPWDTFTRISDEAYGLISRQNFCAINGLTPDSQTVDDMISEMRAP